VLEQSGRMANARNVDAGLALYQFVSLCEHLPNNSVTSSYRKLTELTGGQNAKSDYNA